MKTLIVFIPVICLFLTGCVMNTNEKFSNVEKKLETIEERLASLESALDSMSQKQSVIEARYEELTAKKSEAARAEAQSKMTPRDIQTALKNAGFYTGNIDGKIGLDTEKAIKAFQEANSLKADGVAGSKTKALLSKYLPEVTE